MPSNRLMVALSFSTFRTWPSWGLSLYFVQQRATFFPLWYTYNKRIIKRDKTMREKSFIKVHSIRIWKRRRRFFEHTCTDLTEFSVGFQVFLAQIFCWWFLTWLSLPLPCFQALLCSILNDTKLSDLSTNEVALQTSSICCQSFAQGSMIWLDITSDAWYMAEEWALFAGKTHGQVITIPHNYQRWVSGATWAMSSLEFQLIRLNSSIWIFGRICTQFG